MHRTVPPRPSACHTAARTSSPRRYSPEWPSAPCPCPSSSMGAGSTLGVGGHGSASTRSGARACWGSRVRVGPADDSLTRVSERGTTRRNRATAPGQLRERGAARQPNHQLHVTDVDPSLSPGGKRPPIRMERALRTVGRSRGSQTNGGRCRCCRQKTGGYLDVLCMVVYRPYSDPHSRVRGSNRASHIRRVRGYRRGYARAP